MIQDILLAAIGGKKVLKTLVESELEKMKKSGIPAAELEAIAKDVRDSLEKRATEARERVGPAVDVARAALRNALGVPSREELEALTERLERAVAALERAQAAPPQDPNRKP